jgi:hypothetical protein
MQGHEELLAAARAETGLEDFGDDSFLEGLQVLVRSLRDEAQLNAAGEHLLRQRIIGHLGQRLQIEDWYRRHPDIDEVRIEAPLIGISLPRTGSTALSFLLAEDPNARSLRRWESSEPCPPPSTVKHPDPRIARVAGGAEGRSAGLRRYVPAAANGPAECQELMALDFKSHLFQAFARIPGYSEWLLGADLTSTYRYERRVLKLLQWGFPARPWRLKCPTHLLFLEHLDRAFPDARFVMTHRDPTDVILSVAQLYADYIGRLSDKVDLHYVGRLNVQHWSTGMERALAFRDNGNEARFYDIDFRAMQRDPVGEVRGLYHWLGEPVTDTFEAGMTRWWKENAGNREPGVYPDPATYGLDLDRVRPLFADYSARMASWTHNGDI